MKRNFLILGMLCSFSVGTFAQSEADKDKLLNSLQKNEAAYAGVAKKIWEFAEVGYQEQKSSALLQEQLKKAGFEVKAGVAEIPTAFVASYGSGEPVIAILAEYDALPGISQVASPERKPLNTAPGAAGHACGHHLFGTGSVAAAIAVKDWIKSTGAKGTIRVYGTPAEEGGSGKVYMVRAGLFNDVDATLHWHPGDENDASAASSLANKSGKFRFYGVAAHAAAAPERGRSALDGVEAMNHMVNMMREHVPANARIHYVITSGGEAPNVVPAYAEVYYYVRHPEMAVVRDIWDRAVKAAEGAALGTGTTMDYEVTGGAYSLLPNETLAKLMDKNLRAVGGITYTEEEKAFAQKIQATISGNKASLASAKEVKPFIIEEAGKGGGGSTDVGDVSWAVPTAGLNTATWVPGTAAHSWQAVAAGGTSIGTKGMMLAAKVLAFTACELFNNPAIATEAKKELVNKRGDNFQYDAMVGNRKPALNYRKQL